jgi:hypothetical protein
MIKKQIIGFLGGPGSGKTELAGNVYKQLSALGLSVAWAREFSSYDLDRNGQPKNEVSFYEQYRYSFYQMRAEEEALKQADIVITDAPLILGYIYPLLEKDKISDERQNIFSKEFENLFRQDASRYTNLYFLRKNISNNKKGLNYHTESEERLFNIILRNMLTCNNIPHKTLPQGLELQTDFVISEIQKGHILNITNNNSELMVQT